MRTPEVELDEDQAHFWWKHECIALPGQGDPSFDGWEEVMLPKGSRGWEVSAVDGVVTVSPSILCSRCQTHGFWENGSWRDC